MDKNHQAGVKGLKAAAERGLGVVIMEPLKGGRITDAVPPTVQKIWDEAPIRRTPAEWAIQVAGKHAGSDGDAQRYER